jgi:PAS domain-containing protein
MVAPRSPRRDGPGATYLPDEALADEMDRIPEPAVLYLPGGIIAAVNVAASRLSHDPPVGQSMIELIGRSTSRRSDGTRLLQLDLPFTRALRGEVVDHGERIDIVLPGGSLYRARVTSSPVIRDGTVVGALSVWHDFDREVQELVRERLENGKGTSPFRDG